MKGSVFPAWKAPATYQLLSELKGKPRAVSPTLFQTKERTLDLGQGHTLQPSFRGTSVERRKETPAPGPLGNASSLRPPDLNPPGNQAGIRWGSW